MASSSWRREGLHFITPMTKILSVEERVEEIPTNKCPVCDGDGCTVGHDPNDPTGQTPIQVQCDFCHAEGKITTLDCVTQALTAARLALLTELRDSELLKNKPMSVFSFVLRGEELEQYMRYKGHNLAVEAIKAHINNLINPTV